MKPKILDPNPNPPPRCEGPGPGSWVLGPTCVAWLSKLSSSPQSEKQGLTDDEVQLAALSHSSSETVTVQSDCFAAEQTFERFKTAVNPETSAEAGDKISPSFTHKHPDPVSTTCYHVTCWSTGMLFCDFVSHFFIF